MKPKKKKCGCGHRRNLHTHEGEGVCKADNCGCDRFNPRRRPVKLSTLVKDL